MNVGFVRCRLQVAREHVGESILCVDAVQGKVTENNKTKFGYVQAFTTGRFEGVAKEDYGVNYAGRIVSVSTIKSYSEAKTTFLLASQKACFFPVLNGNFSCFAWLPFRQVKCRLTQLSNTTTNVLCQKTFRHEGHSWPSG